MKWLAEFPTTNGLVVSSMGLAWMTFLAWLMGKEIPDGWLLFVTGLTGVGTAHFTAKRATTFMEPPVEQMHNRRTP